MFVKAEHIDDCISGFYFCKSFKEIEFGFSVKISTPKCVSFYRKPWNVGAVLAPSRRHINENRIILTVQSGASNCSMQAFVLPTSLFTLLAHTSILSIPWISSYRSCLAGERYFHQAKRSTERSILFTDEC